MQKDTDWIEKYGPWAVVTGASGGIGYAMATKLAVKGLNVALVARNADKLKQLASQLESAYGVKTKSIALDLTRDDSSEKLMQETQSLDVGLFVANAGFGSSGAFIQSDIAHELNLIDLNIRALAEQSYYFAQRLKQRGKGGIILISSILAWQPVPKSANYAASKAYVQSLAEALAIELKPLGVDVLSSAPAGVNTGFAARANMKIDGADPAVVAENTLNALGKKTTVCPHFMSKFLTSLLAITPRFLRTKIMANVMSGMT